MRLRVVFTFVAFVIAVVPAARAQTLPDLPGMDAANKAVGGRKPSTTTTTSARPNASVPAAPAASSPQSSSTQTTEAAKKLSELPGTGAIPAVGSVRGANTSSRAAIPGPDALLTLAAIGSFAALGALYMLRRLGRI